MPRNVKESDDEMETKSGRRTRAALNPSVLDSPLRRSTRIKQPLQQDGSSPDSVSDVSSTGATKSTRRRTTTGDAVPSAKSRARRNSIASDVSEQTETESLLEGAGKRVTRRSITGASATETPPNLNSRTRRTVRAGSESKSTPPKGRATRRTRASSLEPEVMDDQKIREIGTPVKSRRRASVLPSEPAVAEELEDFGRGSRRAVDNTVYEIDEDESDTSPHDTSKSSRRRSKTNANESVEKMEVDESPVRESEGNAVDKPSQEHTEASADVSHVPKKLEDSDNVADSSEIKKSDDVSLEEISRPASPSTEEQSKNLGHKEDESPDNSVELLEESVKMSNTGDGCSGQKSVGSASVTPREKRCSISIEDDLVSRHYTTANKSQENKNTDSATKFTEKESKEKRYTVEDCVVVIEPMEIDIVDNVVTAKTSNTPEISKTRKISEVIELKEVLKEDEEIDCELTDKEVEDLESIITIEDNSDSETDLKISNVVSIAVDTADKDTKEEEELTDDFELKEMLHLEMNDMNDITEKEAASEGASDEKAAAEPSHSNSVPPTSVSEEKVSSNDGNDGKTSAKPSSSISEVKTSSDNGIDENASMEPSISNTESPASSPTKKTLGDSTNDEKSSTELSSSNVEPLSSGFSVDNENPINSDKIEENLVLVKGKKSSIVTESPASGANGKETSNASEENRRKSSSNRKSLDGDEPKNTRGEIEEKSSEKEAEDERKVLQSDDDCEYDGYPAFKDIPADEWTGTDTAKSKKNTDIETNSVHSMSTERNESECDFELIDKESSQPVDKEPAKSDYDSDATVKIAIATPTEQNSENNESEKKLLVASEETPMDLSSDAEEGETPIKAKSSNPITEKRSSFETARRISEMTSMMPKKLISPISDPCVKPSLASFNTPRRKVLLCDDDGTDSSNSSLKLVSSTSKPLKKRSLNAGARPDEDEEDAESDDEREAEDAAIGTPKSINASDKKTKDRTPDSRKSNASPTSNLSNAERRANAIMSKRKWSLSKLAPSSESEGAEGSLDNAAGSELTQRANETENQRVALMKKSSSNTNDSPASPEVDADRFNRSMKLESGKKILNEKNSSKSARGSPDIDAKVTASREDPPSSEIQSSAKKSEVYKNFLKFGQSPGTKIQYFVDSPASPESEGKKLGKSANAPSAEKSVNKNSSLISWVYTDAEMPVEVFKESPASPDPDVDKREMDVSSAKLGSAKKAANKNTPKSTAASLDSEMEVDSAQEKLNKSATIGSAEKSRRSRSRLSKELTEIATDDEDCKENLNRSSNSASAKKSAITDKGSAKKSTSRNTSKLMAASSDSEGDAGNSQQNLKKSAKNESAKKSGKYKNTSAASDSMTDDDRTSESLNGSSKYGSAKKPATVAKFESAEKLGNKNTWKPADTHSDDEVDVQTTEKKVKEPTEIGSAKKSVKLESKGSGSSLEYMSDAEDVQDICNKSSKSESGKKSINDRNYSTIAQVNSDSDVGADFDTEDSSDDADVSRKIPQFLFEDDPTTSDDSDDVRQAVIPQFLFNETTSDEGSIDADVARDMNLHGESVLAYSDDDVPADDCIATESESSDDDDDGADLADFVVDDDEEEDGDENAASDMDLDDDKPIESFSSGKSKPRRRIIPRPAGGSDSDESDETEPMNVSSTLDNSKTAKTPTEITKLNKSQETLEPVAAKNKNLLVQSSTPKTFAKQSLSLQKSDSPSATTPLKKSAKPADSSTQLEAPRAKKLSKSVCETTNTPTKLGSSFKFAKTPKTNPSMEQQLQTSLPADLPDSASKTNLSKTKSTKISALNQTVVPPGSESPETRYLMKEKLNESLPAWKLRQLTTKAERGHTLGNVQEGVQLTVSHLTEILKEKGAAPCKKEIGTEPEASSEKDKKKKRENSNESENQEEESASPSAENVTEANTDKDSSGISGKKLKKLNKKKRTAESAEPEEMDVEEMTKKKEKQRQEESAERVEMEDADKQDKKKKKKKKKQGENIEQAGLNEAASQGKQKKLEVSTEQVELEEVDRNGKIKKKKKKQQEESSEQVEFAEVSRKNKKKRKQEESANQVELDEVDKKAKKKKKKDRNATELTAPELTMLRQKPQLIALQNEVDSDSDDAPEAIGFAEARDKALRELRKIDEGIKLGKEAKKKKHQEQQSSCQDRKTETHVEVAPRFEKMKTSVKRLPTELLVNLSDVMDRPKKRRKVVNEDKPAPPKTTFSPHHSKSGSFVVDDGYIPLSSSGGTTQFTVVNLKKAAKQSKKAAAAANFRDKILARNPRHPVSAYVMYQQKQKASGKDRLY